MIPLWYLLVFFSLGSSTKTGHNQTCDLLKSQWSALLMERNSSSVIPERWFGKILLNHTACLREKDYMEMSFTPWYVQFKEEWTIKVLAMYMIFLIYLSDIAFWCCAPTIYEYYSWFLLSQPKRNWSDKKIPL